MPGSVGRSWTVFQRVIGFVQDPEAETESQMILLELKRTGSCYTCGRQFKLRRPAFLGDGAAVPTHKVKGQMCRGSGMSANHVKPVIETEQEALKLAQFLSTDDGHCFSGPSHSMACDDGRDCARTRIQLARIMAEHYLQKHGSASG